MLSENSKILNTIKLSFFAKYESNIKGFDHVFILCSSGKMHETLVMVVASVEGNGEIRVGDSSHFCPFRICYHTYVDLTGIKTWVPGKALER